MSSPVTKAFKKSAAEQVPPTASAAASTVRLKVRVDHAQAPSPAVNGFARPGEGRLLRVAGEPRVFEALDGERSIVEGSAAEHHAVHQFLKRLFCQPSLEAFNASLEDPFYEPCDRLLLRHGERLAGHVLVQARRMRLGGELFSVALLSQLALERDDEERRGRLRLLRAAERKMVEDGAVLGLISTPSPRWLQEAGWTACHRGTPSLAGTRELLAELSQEKLCHKAARSIRPWRQVELPALLRLYAQHTHNAAGPFPRDEATWRWLIGRGAYDQILVATDGPSRLELDEHNANILGYAIIKGDEILELAAEPSRPDVARQLLRRVCSEAIEVDGHDLALHAPAHDPLHRLFQAQRRARPRDATAGETTLAKIPDPLAVLELLRGELHARAQQAGLPRPCELGLQCGEQKLQLLISRRSVKLADNKLGRSYLQLSSGDLTRLLLGALDVPPSLEQGRLRASTRLAGETAAALFPPLSFWRPPLDDRME